METIISSVVAFVVVFALTIAILAWRHRGQREVWEAEHRHQKAGRDAYWGVNARINTLTAEEIAQAEKDRQDFLSLVSGPHLGTALYNTTQEQAILEGARLYATVEGVSLKEGLQASLRRQASLQMGTVIYGNAQTYNGGTPDPREVLK